MPFGRLPISISHYLCPEQVDLVTFLDRVSSYGFSGVGLTERALAELPAARIRHELSARSLVVTSLNSAGFFVSDDTDADTDAGAGTRQDRRNSALVDAAGELGAHALNVIVGGSTRLPLDEARAKAVAGLGRLAELARQAEVFLVVEPLHPVNVLAKSCINTLAQAKSAISGLEGVGLTLDLFHLWWDPDLARCLEDESSKLGLLQICDVGCDETLRVFSRVALGDGRFQWSDVVRRLRTTRPEIPIELELFADQLAPGWSLDGVLEDSFRRLSPLFEADNQIV